MIHFCVPGKPQPAGSKRAFPFRRKNGTLGVAVSDMNPKAKDWKATIALEASKHVNGSLLEGPLELKVIFFFERPKGHYGSGKNADKLRESAPLFPTTRPDCTKLVRGLEDSLSGIVYADDAQIVRQSIQKHYGPSPRTEVYICQVSDKITEPLGCHPTAPNHTLAMKEQEHV